MISKNMKFVGWVLVGWVLILGLQAGCEAKLQKNESAQKELYQCSMHPQIISEKPENCPICGMKLTRVDQGRQSSPQTEVPGHATIFVSPERQQMIGLKTTEVKEMPLHVTIRTLGRVGYDPDLYDSILQYREALIAVRRQRGNPSTTLKMRRDETKELAMQRLRLAGLSDAQIESLTHYGQFSWHGDIDPDTTWVYADIYEFESHLVRAGQKVRITAPSYPGKELEGTVKSADELYNTSYFIQRIRVEMKDAANLLKPGQSVNVEIFADLGLSVAVPVDAVLDTGERQLVFVDKGDGHVEPRQVRLGHEAKAVAAERSAASNGLAAETQDYYEVLEGLTVGEKVVSSATFLIDSESRLQAATQSFKSEEGNAASVHQH